jgi:allophanate hydrolase
LRLYKEAACAVPDRELKTITACGDDLLSIRVITAREAQQIAGQLRDDGDWIEVVPGIDSVVVQFDAAQHDSGSCITWLTQQLAQCVTLIDAAPARIRVPIHYGGDAGPDFAAACATMGLTPQAFIKHHTGGDFFVDMLGFTPGFAYVGGFGAAAGVERLPRPRQLVAAGSVGVALGRTGIYALSGPGGWPIIGHTSMELFDPHSDQPFKLCPGMRVCFVDAAVHGE